jgi:transcriptional regulator with XRE-family HTH domain
MNVSFTKRSDITVENVIRKTDVIELKKKMIERGFNTNTSLAEASGINRNTIGQLLNGEIQPSYDVMAKLAATLELSEHDAGRIFFALHLRTT